jgi:predicted amidohydrolase
MDVASLMMAIGLPLKDVVAERTAHPAHAIRHGELCSLPPGTEFAERQVKLVAN